ncbi:hypothetical protein BHE74_00016752 [Ensete ventricosum]|nr:hypothetical protein BHE74_00016752 [Ensete ventricosum]
MFATQINEEHHVRVLVYWLALEMTSLLQSWLPVRGSPATGQLCQKSTVGDRLKGEIYRRRSTEGEIDRQRSIEREKGKKKKKRKKKEKKRKEEKKNTYRPRAVLARASLPPAGRQRPRAVAACGSPAPMCRRRPRVASSHASSPPPGPGCFFTRMRRKI